MFSSNWNILSSKANRPGCFPLQLPPHALTLTHRQLPMAQCYNGEWHADSTPGCFRLGVDANDLFGYHRPKERRSQKRCGDTMNRPRHKHARSAADEQEYHHSPSASDVSTSSTALTVPIVATALPIVATASFEVAQFAPLRGCCGRSLTCAVGSKLTGRRTAHGTSVRLTRARAC